MSQLEAIKKLDAYRVVEHKMIEEMQSEGIVLEHKKTKARLFLVSNDDENKVFCIGFRTPPDNDCGLPHILEHSVLCGSDKFPLKDPFVELVKGSLNTFLNAMTYPDKTVYPVASCNDKDFHNLMDVYMDAVLHPNIYKEEKIFRQEGWHYELESKDAPLIYNGVVYNEMKGAYSSPESILDSVTQKTLFPDTCYGKDSGGDPVYIPELSYEKFLDFHKTYYHPSNSYIYLYGNMDMAEKLTWLDEEYLSHYEERQVDSRIREQKAFEAPVEREFSYSITEGESEEDATYLSINTVVGDDLDPKLYVAFQILEYTLLDAPGAPLKQALIDAGIGKDILGGYESGILQPYFSVIAKDANKEQKGEFLAIVKGTLRKLADQGINRKSLLAGMNYFEFKYREADYGSAPKGLMYGIDVFDSWLYDENKPFAYLQQLAIYDELKKLAKEGYFENLIQTYLLDNTHASIVTLIPKTGLAAENDAKTAEKLQKYKESLSKEEIEKIIADTKELAAYQEEEESEEALETIPLLKRSDIKRESVKLYNDEHEVDGTTVLHHNVFTNGIGYLSLLFDTKNVPNDLIPYMGVLKSVLGYVDTEHYTYGELFNEINAQTGGINCGLQVFRIPENDDDCRRMFGIRAKFLYDKLDFVMKMIEEILNTSRLDDEKRLHEIISSMKSGLQNRLSSAGNATAVMRAASYYSPMSNFQDRIAGIGFYQLLKDLDENFDEKKAELIKNLQILMKYIFRKENLTVSYTADETGYAPLEEKIAAFKENLYTDEVEPGSIVYDFEQKNEAFQTSGQVQYVALCGNFEREGYDYTGALRILRVMLSYDYLWINIRVKGGAYGCGGAFGRGGNACISSYRDPNVGRTLEVYRGIGDYVRNFEADERQMTKYIIGTISELDVPMNPSAKGQTSESAWFNGITEADFQQERDQILDATLDDIHALADLVDAALKQNNICVVGSEAAIQKEKELFKNVENL